MATIVTTSGKSAPLTTTEMDANFTNLNTDKLEDSASDGSQYARRDGAWVELGGNLVETSSTKPSSPNDGDVWFSESNGVSYVYDSTSEDWAAVGSPTTNGINTLAGASDVYLNDLANGYVLTYNSTFNQPSTNKFISVSAIDHRNGSSYSPMALVDRSSDWPTSSSHITSWERDSDGTFPFYSGTYLIRMRVELEETTGGSGHLTASLLKRQASIGYSIVDGTTVVCKGGGKVSCDLARLINCTASGSYALAYLRVQVHKSAGGGSTVADGNINVSLSAVKLAENF